MLSWLVLRTRGGPLEKEILFQIIFFQEKLLTCSCWFCSARYQSCICWQIFVPGLAVLPSQAEMEKEVESLMTRSWRYIPQTNHLSLWHLWRVTSYITIAWHIYDILWDVVKLLNRLCPMTPHPHPQFSGAAHQTVQHRLFALPW